MKTSKEPGCWKKAAVLNRSLSLLTTSFPPGEKFRFADQFLSASRAVTTNIAEGFKRLHHQEYIQYCRRNSVSLCIREPESTYGAHERSRNGKLLTDNQ